MKAIKVLRILITSGKMIVVLALLVRLYIEIELKLFIMKHVWLLRFKRILRKSELPSELIDELVEKYREVLDSISLTKLIRSTLRNRI
ncbi:MAG: hypothetical protein DRZ82_09660 [Thermoprotei archaeon]|nr:MAG: hypothetical protein DRZ82_09660 [Thermoprotei archaeon]